MDALARSFRTGKTAQTEGLAGRGLLNSGAAPLSEAGLLRGYGEGVINTQTAAQQQENQRKQALLAQLLGISGTDLNFLNSIMGGQLAETGAANAQQLLRLQNIESTSKAAANIAALAVGGALGGMGDLGGAGVGGSGVGSLGTGGGLGTGALGGAQAFGGIGTAIGGGGGNNYSGLPSWAQPSQPGGGGPGAPNTGYSLLPAGYSTALPSYPGFESQIGTGYGLYGGN